jgi:uncharacterized protein (DUF58 family)
LELSPQGTILAWFSVIIIVVGAIFQNPLLIASSIIAFAYLAVRAVMLRGHVNRLRTQLGVRIDPQTITTLVDAPFKFEVSITNSSGFKTLVSALLLTMPIQIKSDIQNEKKRQALLRKSFLTYTVLAQARSPGLYTVSSVAVMLEDSSTLLTDTLRLDCDTVIEVSPQLIATEVKIDTRDPARLGAGTEIAGVREATIEDDFRVIDWSSTARTGKFMAKEFYRDVIPPAIIAVDQTILIPHVRSENDLLHEIAKVMISFGPSAGVGLIIFDDHSVRKHIPPSVGHRALQQMIGALVTATGEDQKLAAVESVTRSYLEIINTVGIMKARNTTRPDRTIDVFTKNLLPYYENALSTYPSKLQRQGSFQALTRLSKLPQPALIIIITGLRKDLSGICEGSVILNSTGHRVAISVISSPGESLPPELSQLRQLGILVLQGSSSGLLEGIQAEMRDVPRIRTRNINTR